MNNLLGALRGPNGLDLIDPLGRLLGRRGRRRDHTRDRGFLDDGRRRGLPIRLAMRIPSVVVGTVSSGFRSISMICPSAPASAIRSASAGVTIKVTTVDAVCGPSLTFCWSDRVPAVRT
jgi:hypothetical protein